MTCSLSGYRSRRARGARRKGERRPGRGGQLWMRQTLGAFVVGPPRASFNGCSTIKMLLGFVRKSLDMSSLKGNQLWRFSNPWFAKNSTKPPQDAGAPERSTTISFPVAGGNWIGAIEAKSCRRAGKRTISRQLWQAEKIYPRTVRYSAKGATSRHGVTENSRRGPRREQSGKANDRLL